ncbi:TRAP-type C4-dicarboxylate transport system, small permease component [Hoeflea sp. IMCC20628]|uniref:TRAP transporter small permease n=1 Tax=Hoeflea sp. IMCC20628 TaxID=1620421 RepID=UPI00063B06F9|nr:TRAP transporter small permease [Hoeflea sp. IMCC20628]AKI00735.1 TRAP-type C4-dicarboxylate transport system, small permease component [Hoeflea sp. IMCC20628]
MIKLIDSAMGRICDAFGFAASLVIAFLALSVGAEVVVRNLGLPAFGWTLEMCEYGLLLVSFLGAPWVLRRHDHISVDVLVRHVSPRTRLRMLTVADMFAALTCAVLAYYATQAALDAYAKGSLLFKYLVVPQWIVLSVLPLGMSLLVIEFLLRIYRRGSETANTNSEVEIT